MPLPALLAVTALAGAAVLSSRTRVGSRAEMAAAQAAAPKARLVELLKKGRWQDALSLNKAKGKERLDLGGADLSGANLTKANLADADLEWANLSGANLTRASLFGANLTGANLTGADLSGANLTATNLTDANLTGANLSGANLTDADLEWASLSGANLADADLTGASLDAAYLPEGLLAPNTRLDAVPWKGTPSGWRAIASPRGARFLPTTQA